MADGSRHSLAYIEETVRGTTPATPVFKAVRHTGTTLALSKNTIQSEEIRNDRQIADFRHGAFQVGGDVSIELSYGSFDDILEAVLCGTWAADTPGVGTDQLKAAADRRYFTLERYFADIEVADKPYHRFTACEFASLSLQISADAMITGSFTVVGSGMETDTVIVAGATYGAAETTTPLDSFTGSLNENGSTIAVITEISLTLENGIDPRFVVGSKESIQPSIGRSNCSGTITAFFENSTLLEKFINETESDIDFTLPDGAGNQYKFILPCIKYNGGQPDVSGEGPITLSMPFQALLDSTEATNLVIERTPI
jgi:hypothetical protein